MIRSASKNTDNSFLNILKLIIYILMLISPFIWSKQINGNYFNAKMFLIFVISGLCLAYVAIAKNSFNFIKLSKLVIYSGLFFIVYMLFKPFIAFNFESYLYIFKPLSFIAIMFFITQTESTIFEKKIFHKILFLFISLLIIFHIYEIYQFRVVKDTLDHGQMLGTFGNVNMLSEFFVLFLPFVYIWMIHQPEKNADQFKLYFKYFLMSLWVFIILYSRSRSSWIGLILFITYTLYKNWNKKIAFSFLLGFVFYWICILLPAGQKSFVDESKKNSFAERVSLYQSATEMIIDHPMGLGLGSFVNELIPYRLNQNFKPHEFEYADQPHSEILKWGVQFGWMGFVLSIGLLIYIFVDLLRLKNHFLMSGFLVIMPQLFFQFPFENPMGILLIGIFAGIWLKTKMMPDSKQNPSKHASFASKIIIISLSVLATIHSFVFITSIFIESQFSTDYEKTSLMCSIYPINHRNCNFKNVQLLEKNETTQFRQELKNELKFSYLTSDLQRILPIYFQHIKDEKHLCEDILIYKLMYPKQKYFNDPDVNFCSKYPTPIKYENPIQFRNDYLNWINSALM